MYNYSVLPVCLSLRVLLLLLSIRGLFYLSYESPRGHTLHIQRAVVVHEHEQVLLCSVAAVAVRHGMYGHDTG